MRVGQLEDLLARLPDDMPVFIAGGGPGLWHIGHVMKSNRRGDVPAYIELSNGYWWDGRRRLWMEPEPDPLVTGRWPAGSIPREVAT